MKKFPAMSVLLFFTVGGVSPMHGETWTYSQCVNYAESHNISLQKLRLSEQTAEYDLEAAKAQWQPTLDFSTTHGYTNRPWGEEKKNLYDGQVGFNAGWTVWNGGQRENSIKRSRINTQVSRLDTEDAFRTLRTDLLQVYLNILYAREAIDIYKAAEQLSGAQADRMLQLMEAGRASRVDYAQLKAQHEQDLYNLVNAQGTYESRKMELKRLLQLGISDDFDLADVEISPEQVLATLPDMEGSYLLAEANDVKLQGLQLEETGAEIDIKLAKAGGLPQISLNAGVGTGWIVPGGAFGTQLRQATNENIGLSLAIPIFDNRKTAMAVAKAKVQRMDAQLDAQQRRTDLAQSVENWYVDTRTAQSRYLAAVEQLNSAQASSDLTNEQFNLGLVNPVELMTAHSNLTEARQTLLQAKYMALLGQKMIEYYRTTTITL